MNNPKDQTFFITGANGSIAIEVVKQLIAKQAKRIVLACRTAAKANDLKQTLFTAFASHRFSCHWRVSI